MYFLFLIIVYFLFFFDYLSYQTNLYTQFFVCIFLIQYNESLFVSIIHIDNLNFYIKLTNFFLFCLFIKNDIFYYVFFIFYYTTLTVFFYLVLICNLMIYFVPHYFNLSSKVFIVFALYKRIISIQIFLLFIVGVSILKLVKKVLLIIKHSNWNTTFILNCKIFQIKSVCFQNTFFPFNLYFFVDFIKVCNFL